MNEAQKPKHIVSLAFTAAIMTTAMIGAGLLVYGKSTDDETFTLVGYIVLAVSALDWAVWELFLKERLLRGRREGDASRQAE